MNEKKTKDIFINGPILPAFITECIAKHSTKTTIGGHSIFMGQIRADEIDGKTVSAINYSAYKEMVLIKMDGIREDIFAKYPLNCMHVYHSLGEVKTGEICLFVFTSSAHRRATISACNEIVERVKSELPIWGMEIFDNTTYRWKENS